MRIGTIGSGFIVEGFIEAANLVEGVSFGAVYSRTQDRADYLSNKYNIDKTFTDLDDMLADKEIDTIYIASPNSLHYEQTQRALEAGKHVIVEKPFVETEERAQRLINLAKNKGCFLFEAICNVHLPHFDVIKENLYKIGKLKVVQANFSQYSSRYDALMDGQTPNVFNPEFSGGALADINIYNIHLFVALFGMPNDVCYNANRHSNGIDTSGVLTFTYPDMIATAVGAKDSFSKNCLQIQGDRGYIYVPEATSLLQKVEISTKNDFEEINIQELPGLTYQVQDYQNAIANQDYDYRDRYLKHSLDVVRVAEAARHGKSIS